MSAAGALSENQDFACFMTTCLRIDLHRQPDHLHAVLSGEASLHDLCGLADYIATVTRGSGVRRLLVELFEVEMRLVFTEHLQLGWYVAERLGHLERVATALSAANLAGLTSEKAAQNSGLRFRSFTSLDEARGWIKAAS
jgi:hypothetical protein